MRRPDEGEVEEIGESEVRKRENRTKRSEHQAGESETGK